MERVWVENDLPKENGVDELALKVLERFKVELVIDEESGEPRLALRFPPDASAVSHWNAAKALAARARLIQQKDGWAPKAQKLEDCMLVVATELREGPEEVGEDVLNTLLRVQYEAENAFL